MQEEVENRTLTLVVNGTKFTGRLFKAAICKYLAHRKEKKLNKQRSRDAPVKPQGKQTVKQLIGQNQGVSNIEITDPSIKEFEKIARKYGVDYAVSVSCPIRSILTLAIISRIFWSMSLRIRRVRCRGRVFVRTNDRNVCPSRQWF